MKSFAAIDFETANQHRSSVCSVGVVVVHNGKVTDKLYRLIKPTPNFYTYWCTEVHGMTNADTDDAMDFPEVWAEIASHIQGLPLVAHNSPFDESCLKAAFEAYDMEYPGYRFYCTCRASRKLLGGQTSQSSTSNCCRILWIRPHQTSPCNGRCGSLRCHCN